MRLQGIGFPDTQSFLSLWILSCSSAQLPRRGINSSKGTGKPQTSSGGLQQPLTTLDPKDSGEWTPHPEPTSTASSSAKPADSGKVTVPLTLHAWSRNGNTCCSEDLLQGPDEFIHAKHLEGCLAPAGYSVNVSLLFCFLFATAISSWIYGIIFIAGILRGGSR